jgi:hypothetical protein
VFLGGLFCTKDKRRFPVEIFAPVLTVVAVAMCVIGMFAAVSFMVEEELDNVGWSVLLVAAGFFLIAGSWGWYQIGQKAEFDQDVGRLDSQHVYVLCGEQTPFQISQNSTAGEKKYLTWLMRDDWKAPRAFGLSYNLDCKRFTVFRNEKREVEFLERPELAEKLSK